MGQEMGTKSMVRVLALLIALALALGASQSVWAQGKSQLPQIKQPTSERFDITGTIATTGPTASLNVTSTITSTGAVSGQNMEQTIDYSESTDSQSPQQFSLSDALVDSKIFFKFSDVPGVRGLDNDIWYYIDIPAGSNLNPGAIPGVTVINIIPSDPALADAYTITEMGKEDLNGAPTTKYQVDIDYSKLLAGTGAALGQTPTPTPTTEPGQSSTGVNFKIQDFVWIGDSDSYLHKFTESMTISSQGLLARCVEKDCTFILRTISDITLQFKDFDQPITITAPANAKPLNLGGTTIPLLPYMPSSLVGAGLFRVPMMPVGMPSTVTTPPTSVETPVVGMPRTGSSSTGGVWVLIAIGLACVSAGVAIRRRSAEIY